MVLVMLEKLDYGMPSWLSNENFWPPKKVITNNLAKKILHHPMITLVIPFLEKQGI